MRFYYLNISNSVDTAYLLERLPGVSLAIDPGARLVRMRSACVHTVGGCAHHSLNGLFWVVGLSAPQVNIYA